jgi:uncharacterized RDD family membrane protein YckC
MPATAALSLYRKEIPMTQLPEDIERPQPDAATQAADYARPAPPPETEDPGVQPGLAAPATYAAPGVAVVPGLYFDPASGLNLPQGTQLASAGRRIGAFFLAIPLSIVTLGIGYLIWGLIVWGRGQTPALQVLGMRCWRPENGRVANWGWMALREIVGRIAENILSIITEVVSLILFLSTKERRSLHDMVAGTVVLYDPDKVLDNKPA